MSRPASAAVHATSRLTNPWWVNPVAGSRWRKGWWRPAVVFSGKPRSRQAAMTTATTSGGGNASAARPPHRGLAPRGTRAATLAGPHEPPGGFGEPRRRAHETVDHPRVRPAPRRPIPGDGSRHLEPGGREQPGVVDEPGEGSDPRGRPGGLGRRGG